MCSFVRSFSRPPKCGGTPAHHRPPSSSSLGLEIELLGSVSSTFYTQCQPQNPTPQSPVASNSQPSLDEPPHIFERRPQSSESAAGKSSTPSRSSLASSTAAAAFAAAARITKRSRDLLRSFRCLPPVARSFVPSFIFKVFVPLNHAETTTS